MTALFLLSFNRNIMENVNTNLHSIFYYVVQASSRKEAIENYLLKDNKDFSSLHLNYRDMKSNGILLIEWKEIYELEEIDDLDCKGEDLTKCRNIVNKYFNLLADLLLYIDSSYPQHFCIQQPTILP
jgi:hypothetical protein